MQPLEGALVLNTDQPERYYLDTQRRRADGYVFAFGGVEIKKNYVSYHLLPIYEHPALLEGISERLKKRMGANRASTSRPSSQTCWLNCAS